MILPIVRSALFLSSLCVGIAYAEAADLIAAAPVNVQAALSPSATPAPPTLNTKAYILFDAFSGKTLASQNADAHLPPASLTKMMTSYVISKALNEKKVQLDDMVTVSEKAWRTGGSKMFIKANDKVAVRDLLQGIIVDSGNDACIAMAEHIAGSEEAFVSLMNDTAKNLGMKDSHFTDSTGMPDPQHYMSAHDAALLAQALVRDFPDDYQRYSQKWFTYNNIKQPNRNRLLWHDASVDGIKTGHTSEAGFCLVASALRNSMRLISVVMGAPSDATRAQASQNLLNYGYRFFETHKLYQNNTPLTYARAWLGSTKRVPVGVIHDFYVTSPTGLISAMKVDAQLSPHIRAPIHKGQVLGTLNITSNGEKVGESPLVALQDVPEGGFFRRMNDRIILTVRYLLHRNAA